MRKKYRERGNRIGRGYTGISSVQITMILFKKKQISKFQIDGDDCKEDLQSFYSLS